MAKQSRFIHIFEDNKDSLLLLNTFTGGLYKFTGENKEILLAYFNKSSNEISKKELMKFLIDEEIIIEDNINENARVELKYYEIAHGNGKLLLTILPTEDCNFRCPYCYEEHNKGKMSKETIEAIKKYVDKNLDYYQMLQVNWFGGEPLEALEIVEELSEYFIKKCSEQNKPYRAGITTNGYNLTSEVFKRLYYLHIIDYQITLDGFKETHNKNRYFKDGTGTFEVILDNLRDIRDNIKTRNINITIRTNITKSVLQNIQEFIHFVDKEFGNDNRFGVIYKIAWSNNKDTDFNSFELLPTGELKQVLDYCKNTKLSFGLNRGQICAVNGICYAAHSNAFVIGSDGKIYKCTIEFDKDINQIGYINKNGKMILDKDKLAFWTMKVPSKETLEKCYNCYFQPACMGVSCPINCYDKNGKHLCIGMKEYVDIYMQLCSHTPNLIQEITI